MAETPFIDMAVHEAVRGPFIEGRAILVFDNTLRDVLWANGPAAKLFGHATCSALVDAGMDEFVPALQQLKASLDRSDNGRAKSMVRITSGSRSRLMAIHVSRLDDSRILVVFHDEDDLTQTEKLTRMISGLDDEGAGAAVIDATGEALAADRLFKAAGLTRTQLALLAGDVAHEDDRLVKRMIEIEETGEQVAVGVGRVQDDPLRCLVLAVRLTEQDEDGIGEAVSTEEDERPSETAEDLGASETVEPFVFSDSGGPVRFVWKMDADGVFTEVSDEFARAIGPLAADIVGKSFDEVSHRFGLDRTGDISASLKRRDTWSGKSVSWPVQNTDKRIPVDLAALPFYNRDRVFEGYRGFGIARLGEATDDPDATGMALGSDHAAAVAEEPDAHEAEAEGVSPQPEADWDHAFSGARVRSGRPSSSVRETSETPDVDDPFEGEVPALHSAKITPFRRVSDAPTVSEEASETPVARQLDANEADAFRQIGEALSLSKKDDDQDDHLDEGGEPLDVYYSHLDGADEDETARDAYEVDDDETAQDDDEIADSTDDIAADIHTAEPDKSPEPEANREPRSIGRLIGRSLVGDEPATQFQPQEQRDQKALPGFTLSIDGDDDDFAPSEPVNRRTVVDEPGAIAMPGAHDDSPEPDADDTEIEEDDTPSLAHDFDASEDLQSGPTEDSDDGFSAIDDGDEDDFPDEMTDLPDARERMREPSQHDLVQGKRGMERQGLTPEALDGLPLPLLIVRGEEALFANASFQIMTGYDTIDDLNDRGGVDALFGGHDDGHFEAEAGHTVKRAMTLVAADGDRFPARAHLQIVPWEGRSALMFALEPVNRAPEETAPYVDAPALRLVEDDERSDRSARRRPERADGFTGQVEELTAILDIATDGVVILARDGSMQAINGPGAALFGYRQDELQGKSFSMLFAHESQRAAMDYMASIAGSGVASLLNEGREVLGREKNGGFLPLFMTMGRLPSDGRMCAVMRDITPWKQTEQALQDAKRQAENSSNSKSEFLAKISHEIRTPLNAIIGFSELMMEQRFGPIGNERYTGYLADINKSGRHVLDLINDLLDISKIEAGKQELSFEGVHLNDAVADALSMVQPLATRERIIMRSSFDAHLPDVVADLRSVKQIVLNLLSNAVRFTPAGGLVVASTSYTNDGGVVLRIKDTGIGMTPKEVETAMQPFKQVADLGRSRGDGTGLGLPLTKALVEANRAEFTIHSEPGVGTIAEIHFPQARVLTN